MEIRLTKIQNYHMHINSKTKIIQYSLSITVDKSKKETPINFAWINFTNSIVLELWKSYSDLFKIKRNNRLFEEKKCESAYIKREK